MLLLKLGLLGLLLNYSLAMSPSRKGCMMGGKFHKYGESFRHGCSQVTCHKDGSMSAMHVCPPMRCPHHMETKRVGKCGCIECVERAGCEMNGKIHKYGVPFTHGCMKVTCHKEGIMSAMPLCSPFLCPPGQVKKVGKCGCGKCVKQGWFRYKLQSHFCRWWKWTWR